MNCSLGVVGDHAKQAERPTYPYIHLENTRCEYLIFVMSSCTFKKGRKISGYPKCKGHKTRTMMVDADTPAARVGEKRSSQKFQKYH